MSEAEPKKKSRKGTAPSVPNVSEEQLVARKRGQATFKKIKRSLERDNKKRVLALGSSKGRMSAQNTEQETLDKALAGLIEKLGTSRDSNARELLRIGNGLRRISEELASERERIMGHVTEALRNDEEFADSLREYLAQMFDSAQHQMRYNPNPNVANHIFDLHSLV